MYRGPLLKYTPHLWNDLKQEIYGQAVNKKLISIIYVHICRIKVHLVIFQGSSAAELEPFLNKTSNLHYFVTPRRN